MDSGRNERGPAGSRANDGQGSSFFAFPSSFSFGGRPLCAAEGAHWPTGGEPSSPSGLVHNHRHPRRQCHHEQHRPLGRRREMLLQNAQPAESRLGSMQEQRRKASRRPITNSSCPARTKSLSQILFMFTILFAASHQFLLRPSEGQQLASSSGSSRSNSSRTLPMAVRAPRAASIVGHWGPQYGFAPSPPARHIYPSLRFAASPSSPPSPPTNQQHQQPPEVPKDSRLAQIQEQLVGLRRQLEVELYSPSGRRRQVTLGSPCLTSSDCSSSIAGSHCRHEDFTCSCLHQHVQHNSTTCLPPSLLGYECLIDAQCQMKVANSFCSSAGLCTCPDQFDTYRKDKCLPAGKINDYCLTNRQCQLGDKHSYCKWRIPYVYGLCKCPPNYKPITISTDAAATTATATADGPGSSSGSGSSGTNSTTTTTRCAPRLGDACFEDHECLLATPNSLCREPPLPPSSTRKTAKTTTVVVAADTWRKNNWRTGSEASSRRCFCAPEFVESPNRLECQRPDAATTEATRTTWAPNATPSEERTSGHVGQQQPHPLQPSVALSAATTMDAKHQYEIVIPNNQVDSLSVSIVDGNGLVVVAATSPAPPTQSTLLDARNGPASSTTTIAPPTIAPTTPAQSTTTVASSSSGSPPPSSKPIDTAVLTSSNKTTGPADSSSRRISSLGKACWSRDECQARDPYSDCINGICECLRPTSRCSARSTGCHKDTFQCRNGQCISWYFVCDQFKNCDDGSDEDECQPGACPPEAFQCDNGNCLGRGKLCNGRNECGDGSDERHCNTGPTTTQQLPASASVGAPASVVGGSMSSSLSPSPLPSLCHPRAFACDNGQCLPAYVFCNAVEDCADGSDESEQVCERPPSAFWASAASRRKWQPPAEQRQPNTTAGSSWAASPGGDSGEHAGGVSPIAVAAAVAAEQQRSPQSGQPAAAQLSPSGLWSPQPNDSPLVKADRASIDKMLAALNLTARKPQNRGLARRLPATGGPDSKTSGSSRESRLLVANRRRPPGSRSSSSGDSGAGECPKSAYTCRNGKCRSSAILCSGVDGCGDNSDEDHCEVCRCQAPTSGGGQ